MLMMLTPPTISRLRSAPKQQAFVASTDTGLPSNTITFGCITDQSPSSFLRYAVQSTLIVCACAHAATGSSTRTAIRTSRFIGRSVRIAPGRLPLVPEFPQLEEHRLL